MYDKYCIFASVLFLLLIQEGSSLKCYQCNSHNDTGCGDETPPDKYSTDCPTAKTYTLCRKIKQVIDFEVNGMPPDNRIIRSCGWIEGSTDNTKVDKCYQRSGFGGRQEVCSCNKDGCNSSTVLYGSTILLTLSLILANLTK